MVGGSLSVGWTHVHGDGLDLGRITSMFAQGLSKGTERFGTAPFDHQQQPPRRRNPARWSRTVPPPGAGLIDGDPSDRAPIALCMCLLNVMHQHPPQTSIVLIEQIGHGIDGHLSA